MAISTEYPAPIYVNGDDCRSCTDVAYKAGSLQNHVV